MARKKFYRVVHARSRGWYLERKGIYAEDQDRGITFGSRRGVLRRAFGRHLNGKSHYASPFFSMYDDEYVARSQAKKRFEEGWEDVTIYEIDLRASNRRVEYRNVRRLADKLGIKIPYYAWDNSEHEWIVLGHIPDRAVRVYHKF